MAGDSLNVQMDDVFGDLVSLSRSPPGDHSGIAGRRGMAEIQDCNFQGGRRLGGLCKCNCRSGHQTLIERFARQSPGCESLGEERDVDFFFLLPAQRLLVQLPPA